MFRVGIIGRPNVGKSTFFNKVVGRNKAITSEIAGTTRDSVSEQIDWNGKTFELTDMGGLDSTLKEELAQAIAFHIKNQLPRFDLLLFIVDAKAGITHIDHENVMLVRKNNLPAWLIINKCDNQKLVDSSAEFHRLGFKKIFYISSIQGKNIAEVLDDIVELIPEDVEETVPQDSINVAILGRPNVGKSSIFNAIVGEQKSQVSEIAGTTRDAVDTMFMSGGNTFRIIDTAGLRRPGTIKPSSLEHFSVMRAESAVERCQIAVVVLDSVEGITHQDQSILSKVIEQNKALIIAANKWDLVQKKQVTKDSFVSYAIRTLDYLSWATFIFTSAKTGEGVPIILEQAAMIRERQCRTYDPDNLSYWLKGILHKHPMMGSFHGKHVKIYGITQKSSDPPHFEISANYPQGIHFSSRRYIENELRKAFDLTGVSVKFSFKNFK